MTKARCAPRDLSFLVADHLQPIRVGAPSWAPSEEDKAHWNEHGWVLLRDSVAPAVIDRLKQEVQDYRDQHRAQTTNAKTGEGVRIGLLHSVNRTAREVAFNDQARTFLRWAFDEEPVLFGSLTFDIGSEQEPHIDAAFFYTRPETAMAGVWTAFEDIVSDAGPLFYVDGSHKWPRLQSAEVLAEHPDLKARVDAYRAAGGPVDQGLSNEVYEAYIAKLEQLVEENIDARMPAMLKKGDVFIWHPWLVHGGMPRLDRSLTRRSMVVHYIGESSKMWDQHNFFLHGDQLESRPPIDFTIRSSRGRGYVWHAGPVNFSMGDGHFAA